MSSDDSTPSASSSSEKTPISSTSKEIKTGRPRSRSDGVAPSIKIPLGETFEWDDDLRDSFQVALLAKLKEVPNSPTMGDVVAVFRLPPVNPKFEVQFGRSLVW